MLKFILWMLWFASWPATDHAFGAKPVLVRGSSPPMIAGAGKAREVGSRMPPGR